MLLWSSICLYNCKEHLVKYCSKNSGTPCIALIRTKIDQECFLYSTSAPTYQNMLDRVQFAACRTITGTLKFSPTNSLEAEANLIPPKYRRTELMIRYAIRTLGIPSHSFADLIKSYYHYSFLEKSRSPLPITGRIYKSLRQLALTRDSFETYPIHQRIGYQHIEQDSLQPSKQNALSDYEWSAQFMDMHHTQYSDRTSVLIDGSVKGCKASCAVWSKEIRLQHKLPK